MHGVPADTRQNRTWGVCVDMSRRKRGTTSVGGVQGKADIPALYTLISYILLESHRAIAPVLYLQTCIRARAIEHNNVTYSDDMDGHVSAEYNSEFPIERVIEDMREVQKYRIT